MNLQGKTVLVTGGAGFIGSNIALALQHRFPQAHILVVDNFLSGSKENLEGFEGTILVDDIATLDLSRQLPPIDVIFHEAALTDPCIEDRKAMFHANVESMAHLLEYVRTTGCKLIYASSSSVYGAADHPMREGEDEHPHNLYGESKLHADELASSLMTEVPQGTIVGLRYFNVYGPREEAKGKTAHLVRQFYEKMRRGERPDVFGDGEQRRDSIYVKDVVTANLLALDAQESGIVNVGSGRAESFNELIRILNKYLESAIGPRYVKNPYMGRYQMFTQADLETCSRLLGFTPKHSLEEGIRDYLFSRA